jgi:hypothetical protein
MEEHRDEHLDKKLPDIIDQKDAILTYNLVLDKAVLELRAHNFIE